MYDNKKFSRTSSVSTDKQVYTGDAFLSRFTDWYGQNPNLRDSLAVQLLHVYMARTGSNTKSRLPLDVVNFYHILNFKCPEAFRFVAGNLLGPVTSHLRKLRNEEKPPCILKHEDDDVTLRLKSVLSKIMPEQTDMPIIFSLAIDATKIASVVSILQRYGFMVGGAAPEHIGSLPEEQVALTTFLKHNVKDIPMADKIKSTLITIHNPKKGTARSLSLIHV